MVRISLKYNTADYRKELPSGKSFRLMRLKHWKDDSLYISGDDMDLFYQSYGDIITGGVYNNGDRGPMDLFGINFYSREQTHEIIERLAEEKPPGYQILCRWLQADEQSLGFYVLGV